MKIYHMIIEKDLPRGQDATSTRTEFLHQKQGYHPHGWRVVGVCGYHEEKPLTMRERREIARKEL